MADYIPGCRGEKYARPYDFVANATNHTLYPEDPKTDRQSLDYPSLSPSHSTAINPVQPPILSQKQA